MGKRDGNKFERVDKDYYATIDPSCMVEPSVSRVSGMKYAEPCYGEGHLEDLLMDVATCVWRSAYFIPLTRLTNGSTIQEGSIVA